MRIARHAVRPRSLASRELWRSLRQAEITGLKETLYILEIETAFVQTSPLRGGEFITITCAKVAT